MIQHEPGGLEVNSYHVRPQLLHFLQVLLDRRPFLGPVVLQEAAILVVVV
jgi:hypothetical protein